MFNTDIYACIYTLRGHSAHNFSTALTETQVNRNRLNAKEETYLNSQLKVEFSSPTTGKYHPGKYFWDVTPQHTL